MSQYNYDSFSTDDYDFDHVSGPRPGDKAPDFTLSTVGGAPRALLDFPGRFLVLELGSITCPLFQSRRLAMEPLATEFSDVSSAVLYVREAHPGAQIPGHSTAEDKAACATRLRDQDKETRTILIDTLGGDAHRAYGGMPNAVFILSRAGCVLYRSDWNNPAATRKALIALRGGQSITARDYFRPARPTTVLRTLRGAGKGAAADFFAGLPRLIWVNLIRRNLRLALGRPPQTHEHMSC